MKIKIFLSVFFSTFFFLQNSSGQILTNTGFELWATGPSSYLDPVGWVTSNGLATAADVVQAPGRTGTYSANLLSVPDASSQIVQANLYFNYTGNLKPLVLSGYWKGNFLASGDFLYVSIQVLDASFTEIGFSSAYSPVLSNVTNWTAFSGTVNYSSSNTPAQTNIQFSLFSSSLNTTGFVDDLTLTYTIPTGVSQTAPLLGSSISRDFSGNYLLNLNLSSPKSFSLNLFSIDGKNISEKNYSLSSGNHQIPVNINELGAGIYFCRLQGKDVNRVFKFVK